MKTYLDIFGLWPNRTELGADIGASGNCVGAMKIRGRLAPAYWEPALAGAARRNLALTRVDLADAEIDYQQRRRAGREAAPPAPLDE